MGLGDSLALSSGDGFNAAAAAALIEAQYRKHIRTADVFAYLAAAAAAGIFEAQYRKGGR